MDCGTTRARREQVRDTASRCCAYAALARQVRTDAAGAPQVRPVELDLPGQRRCTEAPDVIRQDSAPAACGSRHSLRAHRSGGRAARHASSRSTFGGDSGGDLRVDDLPGHHAQQQHRQREEADARHTGDHIGHGQTRAHRRPDDRLRLARHAALIAATPAPRRPVSSPTPSSTNPATMGTADSDRTSQYGRDARTESSHGTACCHRPPCTSPAMVRSIDHHADAHGEQPEGPFDGARVVACGRESAARHGSGRRCRRRWRSPAWPGASGPPPSR